MTPAAWALVAAATVAAVADWVAVGVGGSRGRAVERLAKPAVPIALLALVALSPTPAEPAGEAARVLLAAGLIASLAGDVLLLPPGRFVPGLGAFLLAHLAYLAAFLLHGPPSLPWLAAGVLVAAGVLAAIGRVLIPSARRAGLGGPVTLYVAAILAMAVAATATGEPAAIAGAWLFVTSDALLGLDRLRAPSPGLPRGDRRALGVAVMATYHLAQGLIVLAILG